MNDIRKLRNEVQIELLENILPYWLELKDCDNGGFYGEADNNNNIKKDALKGSIQQARILWTFSSAYRIFKKEEYLEAATHAKRFIIDYMYDDQFGGIYWSVDYKGKPIDTKKQIYSLGFVIYGLSEYHRATGDTESLEYAIKLFNDIENYSFDNINNGYYEAFTREWLEIEDMRLSDKDKNERKTMNTHLHILEPYTNLFRVWKDEKLKSKLYNLIDIFTNVILNKKTNHLGLFFDDEWNNKYSYISYGHDIEASWLLHEALKELNDEAKLSQLEPIILSIANAASEGYFLNNGMIYEMNIENKKIDADRHWWVQAEAIVGYVNLFQYYNDNNALNKAIDCWDFVKSNMIDQHKGEWFWSIKADGNINENEYKVGFWKCPYHNGRMCMEIIERFY